MKLVWCVVLALAPVCVHAQRPNGTMLGAGTVTCGTYAQDRAQGNPAAAMQYAAYTQGYLSAWNRHSSTQYAQIENIPRYETIYLFLDRYCRDNPLDIVQNAVDALLADLGGYRFPYLKNKR